jgi:hypothetical protein
MTEELRAAGIRDTVIAAVKVRIAQLEQCGHWPERLRAARVQLHDLEHEP